MRSWLTYIFLSMVACATVLTSCNDVLSEEGFSNCSDRTTVRLTISFGGDGGPMSRDVGTDPVPEDDDLDDTTEEQAEIVAEDIYALVVDASDKFLYRIKDLTIKDGPASDGYYTRTLEGTMIQTTQQVKIVLLANLIQNKITVNTTALDSKINVETFIDGYEGQNVDVNTIYNQLIYNYDGTTTPWTLTGDKARRIPMWGESQPTTVPPTESIDLTCYLYRALAKVQIWVNMKDGIDGFVINSIKVNNIHTKGYCVSQADFDDDSQHYAGTNGFKPYVAPYPYIPADKEEYSYQSVTYNSIPTEDGKTKYFSDMIYLPEQENTDESNVTITVYYTYNNNKYGSLDPDVEPYGEPGIIEFKIDGKGDRFDIIRNHSYIFNINKVEEVTGKIYYVVDEWDAETINIPFN